MVVPGTDRPPIGEAGRPLSHSLIFYRPQARTGPAPERIRRELDGLPHTVRSGETGDYLYVYANPSTGVEFTLELRDPGPDVEDHRFPGAEPVGLSARVDYLRPCFFGMEALPWIAHVARELGLLVLDPQREGGSAAGPVPPDVPALVHSWDAANARATVTLLSQEDIDMRRAPRAMLESWWRYVMAVPDLREHHGDGAAVPCPELVEDPRGTVTTLITFPSTGAVALPADVGMLFLARRRRCFRVLDVTERGTVRAADLLEAVRSAVVTQGEPHPHLLVRSDRFGPAEEKALVRVAIDTRSRYRPVNPTRLTDVDLASGRPA
jgi:hypothetical protein